MFFLICALVFAFGYVLAPVVIALSWRMGAVDVPQDWRRMHCESVPRNGGLAIMLPLFLGCVLIGARSTYLLAALLGGGLMLVIGLLDDVFCLGPWSKLLFQSAAAVAAVLGSGIATDAVSILLSILWVVMLTNAHNFIDGLDGLLVGCASMEGLLLSVTLALIGSTEAARVALLLTVSCLAFRPYNRYPARAFAGDCGSDSIGFLLGMLSLPIFFANSSPISTLSPIFLFAYPLADLLAAVLRRTLRGRHPFSADRGHLHHRLYAAGLAVPECVWLLLTVCCVMGFVGIFLSAEALWGVGSIACVAAILLLLRVRKRVVKRGWIDRS